MSDIKEVSPIPTVIPAGEGELTANDIQAAEKLKAAYTSLCKQLGRVIVGQEQVIEELLIALFSRGHCILEVCRAWPRR